jgi:hypothetical protein
MSSDDRTLIIPKALEFTCDFIVLHSHPLGYDKVTSKFRTKNPKGYPYNPEKITKQQAAASENLSEANSAGRDIQSANASGMLSGGEPNMTPAVQGSGWD